MCLFFPIAAESPSGPPIPLRVPGCCGPDSADYSADYSGASLAASPSVRSAGEVSWRGESPATALFSAVLLFRAGVAPAGPVSARPIEAAIR